MKNTITTLFLAVVLSFHLAGQKTEDHKVKWYSFEEAIELNKINEKKVFIDVYTDWCGWCKVMDKNTFSHPVIAKYLTGNFYPVKFNAESKDTIIFSGHTFVNNGIGRRSPHQLAVALLNGKMSYPSIAYMNEKNQLITSVAGYWSPENIEPLLKFILEDIYKKGISFENYKKTFVSSIIKE